jgi:hypothetical protein
MGKKARQRKHPGGRYGNVAMAPLTFVIPVLSQNPASPSPWAEKNLFAAQTRVGWIPAQGRHDGRSTSSS